MAHLVTLHHQEDLGRKGTRAGQAGGLEESGQ